MYLKQLNKTVILYIYADDSLKKDKEIVLEAVRQYCFSIQHADDTLKKDKDVAIEAVKQNNYAIKFIDQSLKKDHDILAIVK